MELANFNFLAILITILGVVWALPSSMVEEIKNSEMKNGKVKRAESNSASNAEENSRIHADTITNNFKPIAIKRGKVLIPQILPPPSYQDLYNIQSGLYSSDYPLADEKTLQNYERGLQYAAGRDQLDEALEKAILKGELYGDSVGQQYRYYGPDDRRRKRETLKLRLKREAFRPDLELTPEEVLALLEIYESNLKNKESDNFRQPWTRYGPGIDQPETQDFDMTDDSWLDGPIYPHANLNNVDSNYLYDLEVPPQYEPRGKWSRFADVAPSNKRFLAKRRSDDPTHMLRYLNGPSENDFDTLSRIFNSQKEQKYNTPLMYRPLYL